MNKKKNNKGFSLIELIIAIAILIILTGLLAPQFMKYIEKSREAKDICRHWILFILLCRGLWLMKLPMRILLMDQMMG